MILFRAHLKEAVLFKNLMEVLHNVFKRLSVRLTPEGLFSRMFNEPRTILSDISIPSSSFQSFELVKPLDFSMNTIHFYTTIASVKKKDSILLEIHEDMPHKLFVSVIPKEQDYADRIGFYIQDIQILEIEGIPSTYHSPVEGRSAIFPRMCKNLAKISKEVRVQGNKNYIEFFGQTACVYDREYIFGQKDGDIEFDDVFDVSELAKISKITSFSPTLNYYVEQNQPLKIESINGLLGTIAFYIHPQRE